MWWFTNQRKHSCVADPPASTAALRESVDPTWQRLNQLALWCRTGRLADAELELQQWQHERDCPLAASILLSAILCRRGELDHALTLLRRAQQRHGDVDPAVGQLLIVVLTESDLLDAARRTAIKLDETHGHDPQVLTWLHTVQPPSYEQSAGLPQSAVERLAVELANNPQVIPSLVAAAKVGAFDDDTRVLRTAVTMAAADIDGDEQQLDLCRALTDLAFLADDVDEARRWAHQGLKIDPYCAPLALALARIEDDPAAGPPATSVLELAVTHHPDYADLQAALIRREAAEGSTASARRHLSHWLRRRPQHPLAQKLHQELAA